MKNLHAYTLENGSADALVISRARNSRSTRSTGRRTLERFLDYGTFRRLRNAPETTERSGDYGTFRSGVPETTERSGVPFRRLRNVPESGFYYRFVTRREFRRLRNERFGTFRRLRNVPECRFPRSGGSEVRTTTRVPNALGPILRA